MAAIHSRFRITNGHRFRLKQISPGDTAGLDSKDETADRLARGLESLRDQQEKLYAQGTWALLLIFQAMDAAGKDSTIKHVMSGVNPQGCEVSSFKAPSSRRARSRFPVATTSGSPSAAIIGIFNRSYYEEVLVVRVHPGAAGEAAAARRAGDEEHLEGAVRGHQRLRALSPPQRRRDSEVLPARVEGGAAASDSSSAWTSRTRTGSSPSATSREREHWREYMYAYEDMIRHTATTDAPWYVVPADHKWFTRLVVAEAIADAMKDLDLRFPAIDAAQRKELAAAKAALRREGA